MPLVSIITPVKNAGPWLGQCIDSVLQQGYTDWEWLLVDDHSTDDSTELIRLAAQKDSRIRLLQSKGKGILPALKTALSIVQGAYLTRMDADDLMPPDRLARMTNALKTAPPKTIVTGRVSYFPEDEVSDGYLQYQHWLNANLERENPWNTLYRECIIASPNWLVRTEELLRAGGFDGLVYPEDYDLCFRWYQQGFQIHSVPEITLLWREHMLRTSRNSEHYQQRAFFNLKIKRFLEIDHDPARQLCLWGTGKKARVSASILKQHHQGYLQMSLDPEPGHSSKLTPYRKTEELPAVQILIAVYPPPAQRRQIESYLEKLNLREGRDFWYL